MMLVVHLPFVSASTYDSYTTYELNIATLCLAITTVADERLEKARETSLTFKTALTLFAKCHQGYTPQTYLSDKLYLLWTYNIYTNLIL